MKRKLHNLESEGRPASWTACSADAGEGAAETLLESWEAGEDAERLVSLGHLSRLRRPPGAEAASTRSRSRSRGCVVAYARDKRRASQDVQGLLAGGRGEGGEAAPEPLTRGGRRPGRGICGLSWKSPMLKSLRGGAKR